MFVSDETDLLARVRRSFARGDADRLDTGHPDTSFEELGIDSLDLAEIAAELELEFSILIEDAQFRRFGSMREVADHIAAHLGTGAA